MVSAAGPSHKEYTGRAISRDLEELISNRMIHKGSDEKEKSIPLTEGQGEFPHLQVIWPIICAGDTIGSVILVGSEGQTMGEAEQKLVQTAAGFLGRQMEQ